MARCAASALLAAIEIYNKPTVEYREQTLALLITNAWEVLLKAHLVQLAGGKLEAIYARDSKTGRIERDPDTREPFSIGLKPALGRVPLPKEVKANVEGLIQVRNRAAHLGVLSTEARERILSFGTASVHNFVKLSTKWFGQVVQVPYLLPVGFLGHATVVKETYPRRQRDLIKALDELVYSADTPSSDYSVVMHVDVNLNRGLSGGGNIGVTNDPSVPLVRVSDDEALGYYSATYADVVSACKERYSNYIRNRKFGQLMKLVKADAECSLERKLNPNSDRTARSFFYNLDATLTKLDNYYTRNLYCNANNTAA